MAESFNAGRAATNASSAPGTTLAYASVTALFFAWGLTTSLVDPLVAAVKGVFSLSDFEAQLSASAFFLAYGVVSLPAAALLSRIRPTAAILVALLLMEAGCLVMLVAANTAMYPLVLAGLFTLASGITVLQVAANPLASALGRPERSHFRLTFAQALNSLGTFIGPYLGAVLFLRGLEVKAGTRATDAARTASLAGIDRAFFWIGGIILALIVFVWWRRGLIDTAASRHASPSAAGTVGLADVLQSRWALLGGAAIFLYVGAEVAIGTQMALFLNDEAVLGVSLETAGKLVSLYWGGALVGRLVGSALLARIPAVAVLRAFAALAFAACLFVAAFGGPAAGYIALSIGLANSVMFPVIFTLTLERSAASRSATSGLLCFAIVGGAAIPPLMGFISGQVGYAAAFVIPATCYALLILFAVLAARAPPLLPRRSTVLPS